MTENMQNKHREYIRATDSKQTVCLMVHGITSSPVVFEDVIEALPEEWSIYAILLDGHGEKPEDFSATSLEKWRAQVSEIYEKLQKEYKEIYIFAHSLGTLLTIERVIENPGKVKGMFLFAMPFTPRVKFSAIVSSVKVAFEIGKRDTGYNEMKYFYSIAPDRKAWKYVGFIPRFIDLFRIIGCVKKTIHRLYVPTVAFIHKNDELVSKRARKFIMQNERIEIIDLNNSTHCNFKKDMDLVKEILSKKIGL